MTAESPRTATAGVRLSSVGDVPYRTATLSAKRSRTVTTALRTLAAVAVTPADGISGAGDGAGEGERPVSSRVHANATTNATLIESEARAVRRARQPARRLFLSLGIASVTWHVAGPVKGIGISCTLQ